MATALPQRQNHRIISTGLFRFPPEILIHIARYVGAAPNPRTYPLTTGQDRESLLNLSLCNKVIRGVCRSSGLLSKLTPPARAKNCRRAHLETMFGGVAWGVNSLGIDLGNPAVWNICAHIMKQFQNLDSLVLHGCPERLRNGFADCKLGRRFKAFRGTTLILKRASFNEPQMAVLYDLNRSRVRNFQCIESNFVFKDTLGREDQNLFPKLRSFIFTGHPTRRTDFIHQEYFHSFSAPSALQIRRFYNVFGSLFSGGLQGLRYFKLYSASTPRLSKRRQDVTRGSLASGWVPEQNWNKRNRFGILAYLRAFASQSLEVFVDSDGLSGPFLDHAGLVAYEQHCAPFEKLRLLVFQCERPEILTSFENGKDDCTFGRVFRKADENLSFREHSVWYHVKPTPFGI